MKKILAFMLCLMPTIAMAQDAPSASVASDAASVATAAPTPAPAPVPALEQPAPKTTMVEKESLFFTPNQLISIMRANQGFIAPREAFDENNQGAKPVDPGPRVIALTGIIYHGSKDWTIWLNGERVTPKNIPDRVMGLTVKSDRIHLRWMDIGNQRIVNITLRPNQRYLLDSDTIEIGS